MSNVERKVVHEIIADFTANCFSKLIIENWENYFDDEVLLTLEDSFPNITFVEFNNRKVNQCTNGSLLVCEVEHWNSNVERKEQLEAIEMFLFERFSEYELHCRMC